MQDFDDFQQRLLGGPAYSHFFDDKQPITCTRAPGRLDVMGGVADYSGSLVAEATIGEAALLALQFSFDRFLCVRSAGLECHGLASEVVVPIDSFYESGKLKSVEQVRSLLTKVKEQRWAAYIFGCFYILLAEQIIPEFTSGAKMVLESQVPIGAGVSSSAAIEVATMQALVSALNIKLTPGRIALLAQMVENYVVGAPCGIMDQMASAAGQRQGLLKILCRPHDILGVQNLPNGVAIHGIFSNVQHSVGSTPYVRARVASFMGRKIVNEVRRGQGTDPIQHLTELSITQYRTSYREALPVHILGRDFAERYGETGDVVTRIDPDLLYPVRAASEHAVYENDRVTRFVELLNRASGLSEGKIEPFLIRAGTLMYASHWSYNQIGLGSKATDTIVRLAREAGESRGIFGAKITGGGSGGTVAILGYGNQSDETVHRLAEEYHRKSGNVPHVMRGGLSPGAVEFGFRTIEPGTPSA